MGTTAAEPRGDAQKGAAASTAPKGEEAAKGGAVGHNAPRAATDQITTRQNKAAKSQERAQKQKEVCQAQRKAEKHAGRAKARDAALQAAAGAKRSLPIRNPRKSVEASCGKGIFEESQVAKQDPSRTEQAGQQEGAARRRYAFPSWHRVQGARRRVGERNRKR